jgi:hypothetical protein
LILACAAFVGFRHQAREFIAAFVFIGAAAGLLTVASVVGMVARPGRGGLWRYPVIGGLLLFGGTLCLASLVGVTYAVTNDLEKSNANIARHLHRDPAYPLVGYWKWDCRASFGLAIDKMGRGRYSVCFCGPGSCYRPPYCQETPIYDTARFRVVNNNTIEEHSRSRIKQLLRCE